VALQRGYLRISVDEQGREVLLFVLGDVARWLPPEARADEEVLVALARLIRALHGHRRTRVPAHAQGRAVGCSVVAARARACRADRMAGGGRMSAVTTWRTDEPCPVCATGLILHDDGTAPPWAECRLSRWLQKRAPHSAS
jgi:hypothetical protein